MSVQNQILSRRVEKILPEAGKLNALMAKRPIRVYLGVDPTGARLHLGHAIGLRKLMEFAAAGHEAIFLFGTGTVVVGDPSQRETGRKEISDQEVARNIKNWRSQATKIVDFKKVKIRQNIEWLGKMSLQDFIALAANISAVQLFKREMFQRRLNQGDTVWYHETIYPLLQGYDSVAMDVDLEIGGTDQEFNMLIGRELMRKLKGKEKFVMTLPLLIGTDGAKMSTTAKNAIWLDEPAGEMYGKLMSLPDEQIINYMELCTNLEESDIKTAKAALKQGNNPRDIKAKMASAVVEIYHGQAAAARAAQAFDKQFKTRGLPEQIETVDLKTGSRPIQNLLVEAGLAKSKSEARRLVEQGGVIVDGNRIELNQVVAVKAGTLIQVGKRRFKKIV